MLRPLLFAMAFLSFVLGGMLVYIAPQVAVVHHVNANGMAIWNGLAYIIMGGGFTLMIVAICDAIDEARNVR